MIRPHKSDSVDVSVCFCTRNRPDEMDRALTSVVQSNMAPIQVVVSDDSDDDRTEALVAGHALPITYTRGPRLGLGANRNSAISCATGAHCLFLDDDATLGSEFLKKTNECLTCFPEADREKIIVTGVEMQAGRTIVPNEQGVLGFQSRPYRKGEPLRTVVINAALFPRQLFDDVRFDPRLKYGYDELDVSTRAVSLGFTIVPCFDAVNPHYPSRIGRDEYSAFTNASRLYVTLKRRRWTEGSYLRAWSGLAVGVAHIFAASVKRSGAAGFGEAWSSVAKAWEYYRGFDKSQQSEISP